MVAKRFLRRVPRSVIVIIPSGSGTPTISGSWAMSNAQMEPETFHELESPCERHRVFRRAVFPPGETPRLHGRRDACRHAAAAISEKPDGWLINIVRLFLPFNEWMLFVAQKQARGRSATGFYARRIRHPTINRFNIK